MALVREETQRSRRIAMKFNRLKKKKERKKKTEQADSQHETRRKENSTVAKPASLFLKSAGSCPRLCWESSALLPAHTRGPRQRTRSRFALASPPASGVGWTHLLLQHGQALAPSSPAIQTPQPRAGADKEKQEEAQNDPQLQEQRHGDGDGDWDVRACATLLYTLLLLRCTRSGITKASVQLK